MSQIDELTRWQTLYYKKLKPTSNNDTGYTQPMYLKITTCKQTCILGKFIDFKMAGILEMGSNKI